MPTKGDPQTDPKALIQEAYQIDGITEGECRSIFMDWALSVPMGANTNDLIETLLARYADAGDHPMTKVLREGLVQADRPARRGGWRGRRQS
ncbi:hypothetical protein [Pseudoprimorskyibacter insulae]|uniref:Uncharacterized protein n=1 Tax=Pseudoprimorskyibacter insulae TaxID=1695997 RepID=A0A2R8AXU3_9RHOB|nr:hypothetical protein [Pseudoprimorskyibacter insulae]SPF80689.1 hypothetical protein PRI8871_02500 [Pseudoprimorskyibacter insulae]